MTTSTRPEPRPLTAIVTGSDSGTGRALALAGGGVDVGITYHTDEQGARDTAAEAAELGATTLVRRLDLTELPAAGDVIDELTSEFGGIDILVDSSGTGSKELAVDMDFAT